MKPDQLTAFRNAVDAFMIKPKTLVLGELSPTWQEGRTKWERRLKIPIEIDGEQLGQYLCISYSPNSDTPIFRMGLQFLQHVVCRLDFDPESRHGNNRRYGHGWSLPSLVVGPHWHSWELNRDSFYILNQHFRLPLADRFHQARRFDAALRWYCQTRHIDLGHHQIEPPPREWLL